MKLQHNASAPLCLAAILTGFLACGTIVRAQELNPTVDPRTAATPIQNGGQPVGEINGVPLYRVNVVRRDLDAVNYLHRSGSTKIAMDGTALLPRAKGDAKVQSEKGKIGIDLHVEGLTPANGFGNEYLTYVLWAITPEGTPSRLGEVLPTGGGNKVDLHVTTDLQAFGLIITAEPYFAVNVPSDLVVMQNHIIPDKTEGVLTKVTAHYTLLPRGLYAQTDGSKTVFDPITRNEHSPLELYEAHNAYNIARATGAERYAPEIMAKVKTNLQNADDMDGNKHRNGDMKNQEIMYARAAVQGAEDARISTLRKKEAERQQAQIDARQAAEAQAAQSQLAAQQEALNAERARASADAARAAADREAAERARAEAQAANANAAAADATARANAAQQSVTAMREKLRAQLNAVLATQETPRGLVVTLGDVLFDSGKSNLKQNAQLSLAKVSVILQQYPDLKLQIEGYTDSVGGDDYNLKLSQNRANSTMAFLVNNGVNPGAVTAMGYGKSHPVADNTSAAGRAQNRRVEMVVSGPSIGVATQSPDAGQ
jgi:outer membrane protein OmpA-like peptidoglycan-associated protein